MTEPKDPVAADLAAPEPVVAAPPAPHPTPDEVDDLRNQVGALQRQLASERRVRYQRVRAAVSWVLVVLAVLATSLSVVSIFAFRTLTDTELFVERVGPVLEDPAIAATIGNAAAAQLVQAVDLEQRLEQRLPENSGVLAAPLADAVEEYLAERATARAGGERFQQALQTSLARGHQLTIAVLSGQDTPAVQNSDGVIVLDLTPVVNELLADSAAFLSDLLGRDLTAPTATPETIEAAVAVLEEQLGTDLPTDFGTVTLLESDELATAQTGYQAMRLAVWLAPLLALALIIAAVAVANHRLRAGLSIVVGVAGLLVLLALLTEPLQESVVSAVQNDGLRDAVRTGFSSVLAPLLDAIAVIGVLGVLAAVLLFVLGDSGAAQAGRSWLRRSPQLAAEHRGAFLVGGGVVALLVLAVVPGRSWEQVLVVLLLFVAYGAAVLLARRPVAETTG
jgi:hypothetical protein